MPRRNAAPAPARGRRDAKIHAVAREHLGIDELRAAQADAIRGALDAKGIGDAAAVNSMLAASARRDAFAQLEAGALEYLFLAPEQLSNPEMLERLKAAKPSLKRSAVRVATARRRGRCSSIATKTSGCTASSRRAAR